MSGQQFPINLSGVIVAGMLVLASLLNEPPLQSDRPPAAKIRAEPSGPFQKVPARIWEDPFEAIARASPESELGATGTESVAPGGNPGPNVVAHYLAHLSPRGQSVEHMARLVILPVLVSGAPHPALREQRLRMRVATHAGLAAAGFLPLRSDRIGVWTWRSGDGLSLEVPFEAFKRDRPGGRDAVLLLWLNDEYVSRDLGSESIATATPANAGTGVATATGTPPERLGPLSAIDQMLGALGYPTREKRAGRAPPVADPTEWPARYRSVAVRLIGPASSDSLEPIYAELLGRNGGDCAGAYLHLDNAPGGRAPPVPGRPEDGVWGDSPVNFKLISPHATAPQRDLVGQDYLADGPVQVRSRAARGPADRPCATLEVHRTVATDDRLIAALVDELELRGIDPVGGRGRANWLPRLFARLNPAPEPGDPRGSSARPPRDHVVLISEWDTKFGRTLPALFAREVSGRRPDRLPSDAPLPWVHRFAYVRGLDGDTPAPAANAKGASGKLDILSFATGNDAGFKEPAAGTNQYDYLRRLTQQIAELDWALKRDNRGSIKAFGILGNDYFDKLLILQALKERFPSHLYFTTDLDAGFLDAKVFRWTRNLVVAAPYGLTLHRALDGPPGEDLQGMTPPFRHSYQTGLYLTVLRTLEGREARLGERARTDPPLLFEVGYGRFFGLEPPTTAAAGADTDPLHPEPSSTGFGRFLSAHSASLILAAGAALALILVSAPSLRGRRTGGALDANGAGLVRDPLDWIGARAVALLTVLYLVLGGGWLLWGIELNEEPFAWFSGVSIWPSEIVRLFAGWLSGLCLVYGWRRVRDADRRIACVFELGPDSPPDGPRPSFSAWYQGRSDTPDPGASQAGTKHADGADGNPDGGCRRLSRRICALFADRPPGMDEESRSGRDARRVWQRYRQYATLKARLARVLPVTLLFWVLAMVLVYGFVDPLSPHRGLSAYVLDLTIGLVAVGLPFAVLLFAAVDEARLCRGLLRQLEDGPLSWPVNTKAAGCELDPHSRRAVDHWIATELIAERTAPAAHLVHLPLLVTLFLLLSLSTRFDNWSTPASVIGLIGLSVGIALLASGRLRRTARRIRQGVLAELKDDVAGIEYAATESRADKLRQLVQRIEAIDKGAYTKWYNEPVFRALAWVLGIGVWIVTEYPTVGG